MQALRTCDKPEKSGPGIWVRRLKASEAVHVTVYSNALQGVWIHWNGHTSEPCYSPVRECPGHRRNLPAKQRFYMHVFNHHKRREEFIELPAGAAENVLEFFPQGMTLRGCRLTLTRGGGAKAHLKVEVLPPIDTTVSGPLPQAKDVHETLCQLWNLDPKLFRWNQDTDVPGPKLAS